MKKDNIMLIRTTINHPEEENVDIMLSKWIFRLNQT